MTPRQSQALYDLAMSYLHVPYVWGGSNPSIGLDCSGYVIELLQAFGALPKGVVDTTAQGLWDRLPIAAGSPTLGDLAFFGTGIKAISHVAFCLDDQFMLEAGGGGPACTDRTEGIAHNARIRIRPLRGRKDMVGYRRPQWP